jgi:NADPH-dependent F420 reductase
VWAGSAAQQAQALLGEEIPVVGAFHTVSAATLADLRHELAEDVLLCGRRKADKARVARLVERIPGLRPVNAGPLETARIVETLTPLLISVNGRYRTHAGLRLTGLPPGDHWGGDG